MWDRSSLIFVDLPSSDPVHAARFYEEVFNWETEPHPDGIFHLLRPGGERRSHQRPTPTWVSTFLLNPGQIGEPRHPSRWRSTDRHACTSAIRLAPIRTGSLMQPSLAGRKSCGGTVIGESLTVFTVPSEIPGVTRSCCGQSQVLKTTFRATHHIEQAIHPNVRKTGRVLRGCARSEMKESDGG